MKYIPNKLLCYIRWWLHVQQAMAAPMSVANLPFPGPLPFVSTCSLDPGAVCSLPVVVAHTDHHAVTCSLELIARTHTLSLLLCSPLLLCCPLQVNVCANICYFDIFIRASPDRRQLQRYFLGLRLNGLFRCFYWLFQ